MKQKKRYDAVLLHLEGHGYSEIAKILHVPSRTISTYLKLYRETGVDGLTLKKQTGQPRKLSAQQEQVLFETISTSSPEKERLGPFANWTAPLACAWIRKHFGVSFSERGMRDVFYRIGLSYTRPTYTLKKADPQKQAEFRETFERLKKTPVRGN